MGVLVEQLQLSFGQRLGEIFPAHEMCTQEVDVYLPHHADWPVYIFPLWRLACTNHCCSGSEPLCQVRDESRSFQIIIIIIMMMQMTTYRHTASIAGLHGIYAEHRCVLNTGIPYIKKTTTPKQSTSSCAEEYDDFALL